MASVFFNLSDLNGSNGFVIEDPNIFQYTTTTVSSTGDINGDGFNDLFISTSGTSQYSSPVYPSFVVFGSTDLGADGSIDLSNLDGSNGFVINGINQPDFLGKSVSYASDINGDGITDLIIRDPGANFNGVKGAGAVYVLFGGATVGVGGSIDLSNLDGSNGFAINGINRYDYLGNSISSDSDINGDGINDLIISAPNDDLSSVQAGSVYVVFGSATVGVGGSIDLSSLNGSNGFALNGVNRLDLFRSSISSNSDINADGINDLIISAPGTDRNGITDAGSVYVVFGGATAGANGSLNLSNLDGSNGFAINGINQSDFLGNSISSDSDINGDGITDLIISVPGADPNGVKDASAVYVVFGGTNLGAGGSVDLSSLNGSNGFAVNGINPSDYLGRSISSDRDINGDGITDLIIGVPGADPNGVKDSGAVYVVFGGATAGAGGSIDLSNLDGNKGFAINGINQSEFLNNLISSPSDINGDGITDLIIGGSTTTPNGSVTNVRSMYVLFGGATVGVGGSVDLSSLDGSNGFAIKGTNAYNRLGNSISSDSDINRDGINDLIIGVAGADPNGVIDAGAVYVLFGGTNLGASGSIDLSNLDGSNGFVINGINRSDYLGRSILGAGDINKDGIDDVIINNGRDRASYVLFGSTSFQPSASAIKDKGITTINTPLTVDVLANDSNFTQITSFNTTSTQGGIITLDDNGTPTDLTDDRLLYVPPTDFIGFDSFSYTIDNGQGGTSTATVNIGVFSQVGTSNSDTLVAGNTGELIRSAAGNDLITGGDGNDKLLGNSDNDTLIGGLGNDALCGGWGNDVLTGGEGSDRFWLISNRGTDTITDFEDGVDKLVLFNSLKFKQLSISQSNNNALISVASTGEVLASLTGVQANLLTAADFISSTITFG